VFQSAKVRHVCGKTATAVNLAAALAEKKISTRLIDLDPQANATDLGSPGVQMRLKDPNYLDRARI